jgi:hypothetical protein
MATIINDMSIEPRATPPPQSAELAPQKSGGEKNAPELERTIHDVKQRERDRSFRLWAH